jgi:hypothetical protein
MVWEVNRGRWRDPGLRILRHIKHLQGVAQVESSMHWISGLAIIIGFVALAMAYPWLAIPIGLGAYLLWKTC